MLVPSEYPLAAPAGYDTIEGWLVEHDSCPRCVPCWPKSRRMCLVVGIVYEFERQEESPVQAFVLVSAIQAHRCIKELCAQEKSTVALFFSVSRAAVLAPAVCPAGLTAESWEEPAQGV